MSLEFVRAAAGYCPSLRFAMRRPLVVVVMMTGTKEGVRWRFYTPSLGRGQASRWNSGLFPVSNQLSLGFLSWPWPHYNHNRLFIIITMMKNIQLQRCTCFSWNRHGSLNQTRPELYQSTVTSWKGLGSISALVFQVGGFVILMILNKVFKNTNAQSHEESTQSPGNDDFIKLNHDTKHVQ